MTLNLQAYYRNLEKESVPCELCGKNDFRVLTQIDRYQMGVTTSQCQFCGFIMTQPRPTEAAMTHFYKHDYRLIYTGSLNPESDYGFQSSRFIRAERLCHNIQNLLKDPQKKYRILDVGCGSGVLLYQLRQVYPSADLVGFEPDIAFAAYASEKSGAKVFQGSFNELQSSLESFTESFDLIILNQVLEHLYSPVQKLLFLQKLTRSEGFILIDVPDILSPDWHRPEAVFHLAHILHFTPQTLTQALELSGFKSINQFRGAQRAMTLSAQKDSSFHAPHCLPPLNPSQKKELSKKLNLLLNRLPSSANKKKSAALFILKRLLAPARWLRNSIYQFLFENKLRPLIQNKTVIIAGPQWNEPVDSSATILMTVDFLIESSLRKISRCHLLYLEKSEHSLRWQAKAPDLAPQWVLTRDGKKPHISQGEWMPEPPILKNYFAALWGASSLEIPLKNLAAETRLTIYCLALGAHKIILGGFPLPSSSRAQREKDKHAQNQALLRKLQERYPQLEIRNSF